MSSERFTVNQIMEITGQKKGVIEQFRRRLVELKLLPNNSLIGKKHLEAFNKAIAYKAANLLCTWDFAIDEGVMYCLEDELNCQVCIHPKTIIKSLIYSVKSEKLKVQHLNFDEYEGEDWHIAFDCIIDNFVLLGNDNEDYRNSMGTDINTIAYKCIGSSYRYYIVGKLNHVTNNEDVHVFYNDAPEFNIMKFSHVTGGNCKDEPFKALLDELRCCVIE